MMRQFNLLFSNEKSEYLTNNSLNTKPCFSNFDYFRARLSIGET